MIMKVIKLPETTDKICTEKCEKEWSNIFPVCTSYDNWLQETTLSCYSNLLSKRIWLIFWCSITDVEFKFLFNISSVKILYAIFWLNPTIRNMANF